MKNEYSPRRQERNQSFVCQALVALSLNVESISPHIESNTEQRWQLRFGNMSPLFCQGGRRLHCGLCAGAGQRQLLGEDQELLEGTLVYRSTLHSFRE